MKTLKRRELITFIIILILIIILLFAVIFRKNSSSTVSTVPSTDSTSTDETPVDSTDEKAAEEIPVYVYDDPIEVLTENTNECVFISMYPLVNYVPSDIETVLGVSATLVEKPAETLEEMSEYLETALNGDVAITNIFLGLDLNVASVVSFTRFEDCILDYIINNPDIKFWVLPATPSVDYWAKNCVSDEIPAITKMHKNICSSLVKLDNVFISYLCAEEWLVANNLNYEKDGLTLTVEMASYAFWNSFTKPLTADNLDETFEKQADFFEEYIYDHPQYADLSGTYCIFLCDSLIANNQTTSSIPNVVSALSNAKCIPISQGGVTAAFRTSDYPYLIQMTSSMISGKPIGLESSTIFDGALKKVNNALLTGNISEKHFYIIIDECLNDYFNGMPVGESANDVTTYRGALTTSIRMLKKAYPNASIVLMTPYHILYNEEGTYSNLDSGEALIDYVNVMRDVSKAEETLLIDLYNDFHDKDGSTAQFILDDQVHPNNYGCFKLGEYIARQIGAFKYR